MKTLAHFLSACVVIGLCLIMAPAYEYQTSVPIVIRNGNLIYLGNTVVLKYKKNVQSSPEKTVGIENTLSSLLKDFHPLTVDNTFKTDDPAAKLVGLERIMTFSYAEKIDPLVVAAKIRENPSIEWAEPKYIRQIDFVPNDTGYNSSRQWGLFKINAQQAWDISKGDSSVLIGIIDTGVDWPHPDLRANMWDSIGYDLGGLYGTPDNDPIEDVPAHGTLIAGLACAVTNNITGIASVGFKCRIMAVKVARNDVVNPTGAPNIYYGYEGIAYAAEHGAKVINCSWGGYGYSNAEQETINFATLKGSLVVAPAGNDNWNEEFYPAAYHGVLAVASTDRSDHKSKFSNYGYYVDCSAPGEGIYSTWQPNTYISNISGTSVSSPLVSGLAGLVASHFPNYTPFQIAEQIRVNCDNIDSLNPGFEHKLGGGRINAYKALNNTNSISVRAYNTQFFNYSTGGNINGTFLPGQLVGLRIKLRNYLSNVSNIKVSLQSLSNYVTIENGDLSISSMGTLDSADNFSNPFTIKLSNFAPFDNKFNLLLTYSGDNYIDYQGLTLQTGHNYLTQNGNNISVTLTSEGNIGFNDSPYNSQGKGFKFNNSRNLLFEGALMCGISASNLSDVASTSADIGHRDTSFHTVDNIQIQQNGKLAAEEVTTSFTDRYSGIGKVGVDVNMYSYAFNDSLGKNYMILKYKFANIDSADIKNFYAGLYLDWDISLADSARYDSVGKFAYVYEPRVNPTYYLGEALLSSTNFGYWAILNPGGDGGFGIYDGFTKSEKWKALSSGIGKKSAGLGDVSQVVSAGPFDIPKDKNIVVAFVIAASYKLNDLRKEIDDARNKYKSLLSRLKEVQATTRHIFELYQNYPNPFNPTTNIKYSIPKHSYVTLKIYNVLGQEVATLVNETKVAGNYEINWSANKYASGIYFYQIKAGEYVQTKKMILLK